MNGVERRLDAAITETWNNMKPLSNDEIHERVTYHPPSDEGKLRHAQLSEAFERVIRTVRDTCPVSRETSLTVTKLEEAKMWASAAVARHPETR